MKLKAKEIKTETIQKNEEMKKYEVHIDATMTIEIEADSIENAKDKALDMYDQNDLIRSAEASAYEKEVK